MIVTVDQESSIPPYEQVRASLARQINDRLLPVGAKLPTVRKLAAELGIAPNTVARAYRELEEVNLIETRGRAGSFVGSSGDKNRKRAQLAARKYAQEIHRLGVSETEALAMVTVAIKQEN